MTGATAAIVWIIVAALFFLVEGITVQLVGFWFAVGSLFAMLTALVGAPFWGQMLVFLIVSVAVLVIGRPFLMEKMKRHKVPTNHDRNIGQVGLVLEEINNMTQTGRVHVDGLDWTARSERGEVIAVNEKVIIRYIDGVKLIVQPLQLPSAQENSGTPSLQYEEEK